MSNTTHQVTPFWSESQSAHEVTDCKLEIEELHGKYCNKG